MLIKPNEARRFILLVSPSLLDGDSFGVKPNDTITSKMLSGIAHQRNSDETYHCWLIFTKQSEETAHELCRRFATTFEFGNLLPIESFESSLEIFTFVQTVASDSLNGGQTIICDCTGGTKTMSIALALACNHYELTADLQSKAKLLPTFFPPGKALDIHNFSFHALDLARLFAEEQRRYVDQQQRIGRLHYLARFSPILAHEIKNPLNLINLDLRLLHRQVSGDYARELLGEIENKVEEIGKVINSVQQAVRKEAGIFSQPAISLVEAIQRLKGRTAKRFPNLILSIGGEVSGIRLRITEEKFYSILANLIDNAAQATNGTGKVTLNFEPKENRLLISVEDNGPGIPAELRSNLFKPLHPGKNASGSGMGLSIVKTFVVEEGGLITLDDAYDHGTRFLIDLPLEKNGEA